MLSRYKKRGALTPRCRYLLGNPVLNVRLHPDHKAGTDGNLLWEGALSDTGVNSGFRESSCCFDLREAEELLLEFAHGISAYL
jgi:hypothetical protein